MSIPERYKYPFDKTGMSPNNLVYPETRTVTKQVRTIVPKEGAYFTQSLIVTFNGKVLKRGVDYKPAFLAEVATVRTNKEVCGAIYFTNDKVIGDVILSYQVVGGELSEYSEANKNLVDVLDGNSGAIRWDQIVNIPEAFIPTAHMHHVADLIGTGPFVIALNGIKQAIENLRSHRNVAIYRLIGSIHTRVNNFIEKYNDNDNYLRDTVADLKQRVGTERLVTEPVFNLAKRELDRRVDVVERGLNSYRTDLTDTLRVVNEKINGATARQEELTEAQKTLKQRVDSLSITTSYTGSEEGGLFITAEKSGDTWTIKQADPNWLVPLRNRVGKLEGKTKQLETTVRSAEERIGNIENELPNFRALRPLIEANTRRVEEVNTTLATRIEGVLQGLTEKHQELNTKVDNNKKEIDTKVKTLDDSITPRIEALTNPLTERVTALEEENTERRQGVEELKNVVTQYKVANDARVTEAEKAHQTFKTEQLAFNEAIKALLDGVEITASYQGTRENGEYITVEKVGNKFKLKYQDPAWLSPIETRIGTLETTSTDIVPRLTTAETKLVEHTNKLSAHDEFEGRIATNTKSLNDYRGSNDALVTALRQDVDNHHDDFDKRIKALVAKDESTEERVSRLEGVTTGFDIVLNYTGTLSGTGYMTLLKEGNQYKINYSDASGVQQAINRATALETRATALEEKDVNLGKQIEQAKAEANRIEKEYKAAVSALDEKASSGNQGLEEKLTALTEKEANYETATNNRLDQLSQTDTQQTESIAAINAKLAKLTVSHRYTGADAENGAFVTVESTDGGFVIKQADPKWLAPLKEKVESLSGGNTSHNQRLTVVEAGLNQLEGRVREAEETNTSQQTRLNDLGKKDAELQKALDTLKEKESGYESSTNEKIKQIETLNTAQENRLDLVERWKTALSLTSVYKGSRKDGEFITIETLDNKGGWKINYNDPKWLSPLLEKVEGLTTKLATVETGLTNAVSRLGGHDELIQGLRNGAVQTADALALLRSKDEELNGKISAEITRATEAEGTLNTKLTTLKDSFDTLVGGLDNRINNRFNEEIKPYANRLTNAENNLRETDKRVASNKAELDKANQALTTTLNQVKADLATAKSGSTENIEQLERRVGVLETAKGTLENKIAEIVTTKASFEKSVNDRFESVDGRIGSLTEKVDTQEASIISLKAEDARINRRIDKLKTEVDNKATISSVNDLDTKLTGLVNTTKEGLEGKITQAKSDSISAAETYTNTVRDAINANIAKTAEASNAGVETLKAKVEAAAQTAADATKASAATDKKLEDYKAGEGSRLSTHQENVVKPAIDTAVDELRNEVHAKEEEEKQKTDKYRETMNEILEFLQNYFVRADGPYLKTNAPKLELMPVTTVNLTNNEKDEEEHEPYMNRSLVKPTIYPKVLYPYSQFQPIEVGVEIRVVKQGTHVQFGYLGFKERDPNGAIVTLQHATVDKNKTIELVSIRRNEMGYSVDFGANEVPTGHGLIIYPKSGLDYDKPESYQIFDYNDFFDAQGRTGLHTLHASEHILKLEPNVTYVASRIPGDFGFTTPLTSDGSDHTYTDGQWKRVSMRIEGGWWKTETNETRSGNTPFAGTKFIVPAIQSDNLTGVEFRNFYVRPVENKVTLDTLPGIEVYLDKWLKKKVAEQTSLPPDSRWDISRFRIQPGAENFSSVSVDENDNLEVRGIVYYDTVGKGKRGVFAPTTEIAITTGKTWNVPDEYDGRVALVTVRAASRREVNKVIHSCVRQVMVTLTGGTAIPIQVGEISSFGTHVTVSNAIDYPDAIVGRIESPQDSRVNGGLVSIKV